MRKHFLFLLFGMACLIACPAWALQPCHATDDYVQHVDKIIDNAVGHPAELAVTVFPSFEKEYGIRMIGNEVFLVRLRTSLWDGSIVADGRGNYHRDFATTQLGAFVQKASLSKELATRVRQRFKDAISAARNSDDGGLDGTTYRVALSAVACGQTWSPQSKSADGQLVDLTELLAKHAQLRSSFFLRLSEEKIVRRLTDSD